ncbi:hypothetical protein RJT34_31915 [Clitoria ternatea]|uniref:Uncharacterized protein n=1 Tax=Clitoria ternatea TaxID=43366 RepID=A0AAN9I1S5_CLITE
MVWYEVMRMCLNGNVAGALVEVCGIANLPQLANVIGFKAPQLHVEEIVDNFGATVESRKSPGEYWKMVMKDQEMPEGILQLIQPENNHKTQQEQLVEGEEPLATNAQLNKQNIDPRPNVSAYGDFEPRPSATKYNDDFKPRPSTTKNVIFLTNPSSLLPSVIFISLVTDPSPKAKDKATMLPYNRSNLPPTENLNHFVSTRHASLWPPHYRQKRQQNHNCRQTSKDLNHYVIFLYVCCLCTSLLLIDCLVAIISLFHATLLRPAFLCVFSSLHAALFCVSSSTTLSPFCAMS